MTTDDDAEQADSKQVAADDARLFRRAMADAKPIARKSTAPLPRRVIARAHFREADERQVLRESLAADIEEAETMSGQGLRFQRPAVGRRTMRKLARGNFSVLGEIDLHGMTVHEAAAALQDFIDASCRKGIGCVRVVHGKGLGSGQRGPVLKGKVDLWLRRRDAVLAFVSARQKDGGTGAVYVLLDTS